MAQSAAALPPRGPSISAFRSQSLVDLRDYLVSRGLAPPISAQALAQHPQIYELCIAVTLGLAPWPGPAGLHVSPPAASGRFGVVLARWDGDATLQELEKVCAFAARVGTHVYLVSDVRAPPGNTFSRLTRADSAPPVFRITVDELAVDFACVEALAVAPSALGLSDPCKARPCTPPTAEQLLEELGVGFEFSIDRGGAAPTTVAGFEALSASADAADFVDIVNTAEFANTAGVANPAGVVNTTDFAGASYAVGAANIAVAGNSADVVADAADAADTADAGVGTPPLDALSAPPTATRKPRKRQKWHVLYSALLERVKKDGGTFSSIGYRSGKMRATPLSRWIQGQRRLTFAPRLTKSALEKLSFLDMVPGWRVSTRPRWISVYNALKTFSLQKKGSKPNNPHVVEWIAEQKHAYASGKLPVEKMQLLHDFKAFWRW